MTNIPVNVDVFKRIESLAPINKAYEWDNVGLQIGSYNQQAKKVLVTLDVLESVVDEAIEKNINLIIAHHPLFFNPLKRINTETAQGRIISKLIRNDISVYAAHTNLDVVEAGVNDMLADKLGLKNTEPLEIIEFHQSGEPWGLGRIGEIDSSINLEHYVSTVKEKLNVTNVRVVGDLNKSIKKIAIIGGSGEKYINQAKRAGADVYITGDLSFHPAQDAWQMGLAVIDAGHYIEALMKEELKIYLEEKLSGFDTEVIVSETNTDPFQYL